MQLIRIPFPGDWDKNTRIQDYKIKWPESRCRAIGTGIYRLNYPIKQKTGGNNLILKIKTGSSHRSRSSLILRKTRGGQGGSSKIGMTSKAEKMTEIQGRELMG